MTVHARTVAAPPSGVRYVKELEGVDRLRPGQVMVVSHAEGCYFGELLSTAAMVRGAVGLVHDCYIRDSREIRAMGFPAFVRGTSPQAPHGRMAVEQFDVPITCGDVSVMPGDLIVGDCDGVAVVPSECADEVAHRSRARLALEDRLRDAVKGGGSLRSLFQDFGAA